MSYGKDMLSRNIGVLAEEVVSVGTCLARCPRTPKQPALLLPTVSVKLLSNSSLRKKGVAGSLPSWACGPDYRALPTVLGGLGYRIVRTRFAREISLLRSNKIPPFLPREFGGGGFPTQDVNGALRSLRPKWARALRVAMSQNESGGFLSSALVGAWTPGVTRLIPSWMRARYEAQSAEVFATYPGLLESEREDPSQLPSRPMVLESVMAAVGAAHLLEHPSDRKEWVLTLRGVRESLETALESLNSLVPYPALTDRPSDLLAGLTRYLRMLREPVGRLAVPAIAQAILSDNSGGVIPHHYRASSCRVRIRESANPGADWLGDPIL